MEPELRFKGLPRHDKDHLGEGRCIASASALWADDARRTAFVPEELLQRWALASRRRGEHRRGGATGLPHRRAQHSPHLGQVHAELQDKE